jgi:hypothetical protein
MRHDDVEAIASRAHVEARTDVGLEDRFFDEINAALLRAAG